MLGLSHAEYGVRSEDPRYRALGEDTSGLHDGIKHKPETTFGNVKADADKDPSFRRGNFCSVIRAPPGEGKPPRPQSKIQALRLSEASVRRTGRWQRAKSRSHPKAHYVKLRATMSKGSDLPRHRASTATPTLTAGRRPALLRISG
jgi:hypothetical protein